MGCELLAPTGLQADWQEWKLTGMDTKLREKALTEVEPTDK